MVQTNTACTKCNKGYIEWCQQDANGRLRTDLPYLDEAQCSECKTLFSSDGKEIIVEDWEKELQDLECVWTHGDIESMYCGELDSEPFLYFDDVKEFVKTLLKTEINKRVEKIRGEIQDRKLIPITGYMGNTHTELMQKEAYNLAHDDILSLPSLQTNHKGDEKER